jgi:hypothetical protein
MQAYQQKTEKFFVIEEKKFGRIDSCVNFINILRETFTLIDPESLKKD